MLNKLKRENKIENNKYSYNYIPAYTRKYTHYGVMDLILNIFNTAIVIVCNGDGTNYFCRVNFESEEFCRGKCIQSSETSSQIEYIIKKYPNRPIFVTGFHCVGMSITLISEKTGNFDNIIISHYHYDIETLYQLIRGYFNYTNWNNQCNIKSTKLYLKNDYIIANLLEYEKQIEHIAQLSGSVRTLDEVKGNIPIKPTKKPREERFQPIEKYTEFWDRKYTVDDKKYEFEIWGRVKNDYFKHKGHILSDTMKSMPKKNDNGFYTCSTTDSNRVHLRSEIIRLQKSFKWHSNFAINKNNYKYIRIYVGYETQDNPNDYLIYVRYLTIKNCPEVNNFFESL